MDETEKAFFGGPLRSRIAGKEFMFRKVPATGKAPVVAAAPKAKPKKQGGKS